MLIPRRLSGVAPGNTPGNPDDGFFHKKNEQNAKQ